MLSFLIQITQIILQSKLLKQDVFLFLIITAVANVQSDKNFPHSLGVRDSFMIAHSFHNNPAFGPAQNLVCRSYSNNQGFQAF